MTWLILGWCVVGLLLAVGIARSVAKGGKMRPDVDREPVAATAPDTSWLDSSPLAKSPADEMPIVHEILVQLERQEPRIAKIALLKWIGGLSTPRVAESMHLQVAAVERDLRFAQTFLRHGTYLRESGRVD